MKYVIDRIVDGIATMLTLGENEESVNVTLEKLYPEAKEGDVVELSDGRFVLLDDETENRKNAVESRFNRLAKRRCDR